MSFKSWLWIWLWSLRYCFHGFGYIEALNPVFMDSAMKLQILFSWIWLWSFEFCFMDWTMSFKSCFMDSTINLCMLLTMKALDTIFMDSTMKLRILFTWIRLGLHNKFWLNYWFIYFYFQSLPCMFEKQLSWNGRNRRRWCWNDNQTQRSE